MGSLDKVLIISLAFVMALLFSSATLTMVKAETETPLVTLDPFPAYTNDKTPAFSGTATHAASPIAAVEWRVDEGSWNLATPVDEAWDELSEDFTFTTPTLSDGSHKIEVKATTKAGYTTAPADYATATFTIDTVAPSVTLTQYPPNPTNSPTPIFSGQATDNISPIATVEYGIDSESWHPAHPTDGAFDSASEAYISTINLADGSHTIRVRATDAAGNVSTLVIYTFIVDTTAPLVALNNIPDFVNQLTSISGTASDTAPGELDEVKVMVKNTTDSIYWDGTNWVTTEMWLNATGIAAWSYDMPTLADGKAYTMKAKSIDKAGNESTQASDSFVFDTTKPSVPVLLSPENGIFLTDLTPNLDWHDVIDFSGVSYNLQIDNDVDFSSLELIEENLTISQYTPNVQILSDGIYHWRVKSIDSAGNEGEWTQAWFFTIDTTSPSVTINNIPDFESQLASVSGTASDTAPGELDKVKVMVKNTTDSVYWDGTNWVTTEMWLDATGIAAWSYDMPTLADGKAYMVEAKSIDKAGNESAVASDSFTLNTTSPAVPESASPEDELPPDSSPAKTTPKVWIIISGVCVLALVIMLIKKLGVKRGSSK